MWTMVGASAGLRFATTLIEHFSVVTAAPNSSVAPPTGSQWLWAKTARTRSSRAWSISFLTATERSSLDGTLWTRVLAISRT
ncbi:hypothetical protein EV401DRAFT_77900 [Pisolithus croceorrhizus]|nr:hypothetical protein EV401DRAFT_77900 [Pisolithus croceorrhizus]